jgi:hypothetical protein
VTPGVRTTALGLGLLLALSAAPAAEPRDVQVQLEKREAALGEPLSYTLTLKHPRGQRYELVTPAEGALGAIELVDQQRQRSDSGDEATTTFTLKIAAFELGKQHAPELHFEVVSEAGTASWKSAQGPDFEVKGALPPEAEEQGAPLNDIRPPEEVPVRSWLVLWVLAAMLAAGAIGFLGYRWWKRRATIEVEPVAPPRPLPERTLAALDALRKENLPGQARWREFYFQLSEILRGYLGERYSFDALECTTSELLERLRALRTPGLPMEGFTAFCFDGDLIKFGKGEATANQCKAALELGYQLVSATNLTTTPDTPEAGDGEQARLP